MNGLPERIPVPGGQDNPELQRQTLIWVINVLRSRLNRNVIKVK